MRTWPIVVTTDEAFVEARERLGGIGGYPRSDGPPHETGVVVRKNLPPERAGVFQRAEEIAGFRAGAPFQFPLDGMER